MACVLHSDLLCSVRLNAWIVVDVYMLQALRDKKVLQVLVVDSKDAHSYEVRARLGPLRGHA